MILDAAPGSKVLFGLPPGVTSAEFYDAMGAAGADPLPEDVAARCFHWVDVSRGDVVYVPAGTMHALGKGIVLLEVQQTSDITYRVHDWGRVGLDGAPRQLHLTEARQVGEPPHVTCPSARICEPSEQAIEELLDCDKFAAQLLTPTAAGGELVASTRTSTGQGFHILAGYEGTVELRSVAEAAADVTVSPGEVVLLPAVLGDYTLMASQPTDRCLRFFCA